MLIVEVRKKSRSVKKRFVNRLLQDCEVIVLRQKK